MKLKTLGLIVWKKPWDVVSIANNEKRPSRRFLTDKDLSVPFGEVVCPRSDLHIPFPGVYAETYPIEYSFLGEGIKIKGRGCDVYYNQNRDKLKSIDSMFLAGLAETCVLEDHFNKFDLLAERYRKYRPGFDFDPDKVPKLVRPFFGGYFAQAVASRKDVCTYTIDGSNLLSKLALKFYNEGTGSINSEEINETMNKVPSPKILF